MLVALVAVGITVAVVSAIRGIWSPCGLSMLSSITPMTEAGRGYRFRSTATWFLVGGIAGGATLGLTGAAGAWGLHALGTDETTRLLLGGLLLVATAAIDLGLAGIELPIFKRQVNDAWLRRYRSWVYGAGFGWQIGVGLATYIMTAGVFATLGLAALTGEPLAAMVVGLVFGVARGSAVFLGRSATTPAALGRVHARLDARGPASQRAAAGGQVVGAGILLALAVHPLVGVAVPLALVGIASARHRVHPSPVPAASR